MSFLGQSISGLPNKPKEQNIHFCRILGSVVGGVPSSISLPIEGAPPLRNSLISLQPSILTYLVSQHFSLSISSCPVFLSILCVVFNLSSSCNKIGAYVEL